MPILANVNIKTFNDKQSPLHYAAKYEGLEAMKVLIGYGADINALDVMQRSPMFIAAEYGEK